MIWMIEVARALTPPLSGAAATPAGAALTLPFPDGTPVSVSCGYSPNCSPYHDGLDQSCCTNDYYALDLVRQTAGGGNGEPVTAVADGTVVYADWATGGWSTFGRIVLIEHDFGDGHVYTSLYAHLSDWSVSVGDPVSAKDQVGLMGGSGNYGDAYFGAHLHFALYQDASFLGGPYGGHSTVPEPIDGYEDLIAGDSLESGPGSGEGAVSLIVDDQDPGFALVGGTDEAGAGGYRDHFYYAPAAGSPTVSGRWTPTVTETGLYTVSAYVPYSSWATATRAPFSLHAQGELADATQDQSIIGGAFHDLFGRAFKLVAGTNGFLELDDGSGESASVYVAWDAVRFDKVGEAGPLGVGDACTSATECVDDLVCDGTCREPCTATGCAVDGVCDASTGLCDEWPEGSVPTTPTSDGTSPATTGTDGTSTSDPKVYSAASCGCASTGPGALAWVLVALALVSGRRPGPRP